MCRKRYKNGSQPIFWLMPSSWLDREFVERGGLTQARAAQRLGLTQPRLNALLRGKIDLFSLDALVNAGTRADFNVELRVTSAKRNRDRAAVSA